MKGLDRLFLVVLTALAAFIWLRDRSWLTTLEDCLPAFAALPLFIWLGKPWIWRDEPLTLSPMLLGAAILCLLFGIVAELTLALAMGWSLLCWAWLRARIAVDHLTRIRRLMLLTVMAFPWVTLDAEPVGWWFRLTGAWATGVFYQALGCTVLRVGTDLQVDEFNLAVTAACSGLNTLQSMLVAGAVLAYVQLGQSRWYWWSLPILLAMSWLANTVRILAIAAAGLLRGPEFARTVFHDWGGWGVLVLMFGFTWLAFALIPSQPLVGKQPA